MSQPGNSSRRRGWSTLPRPRTTRLREIERQLLARLDALFQRDRRGYAAVVAVLGRVLAQQAGRIR